MKYIKDYFNNHRKLKRIVKILGVVAIVFSFLLNTLIIAGLIINATHKPKASNVLAYGDYQPQQTQKGAIDNRYNIYIGFGDFLSLEFAEQTYTILTDPEVTNIGGTGYNSSDFNNGTIIRVYNPNCVYCSLDSTGTNFTQASYSFDYIEVRKDTSFSYPRFNINLVMYQDTEYWIYQFYYARYSSYNENNDLIYSNWSTSVNCLYSSDNGSTFNTISLSPNYSIVYFSFGKDIKINWLGTANPKYNDYYNEGYDAGYNNGYNYGYSEGDSHGYGVGYYDGVQAGQEGESTMFTLISQAFNAIASILDIQVLPNLSLGLLIFTPLIVTIIIVVVKMVKG